MFLAQVPKIFLRLGPKIFTNFTSFKNIFIMAKCDDDYDDVMAAKGRHLMAAYGQQTLSNFHSCPNSLLRNKKCVLLPKMSTLFQQPGTSQSVCLLHTILLGRVRLKSKVAIISEMLEGEMLRELFKCVRTKLFC